MVYGMLSFLAGGSTSGLVKPAAYDIIDAPMIKNSGVREITHDVWTILPTSERITECEKVIYRPCT